MEQINNLTNQKGSSVKTLRKIGFVLYFIALFIAISLFIFSATRGVVINLQQSPMVFLTAYFLLNIYSDNKKKLEEVKPWYKSKWGWFIVCILLPLMPMVLSIAALFLLIPFK